MEQWLGQTPGLTAHEADLLVDQWLRTRLVTEQAEPLDTNKLTLRELATALGAREEELAILLCDIRDGSHSRQKKLKRAIPVRRSWKLIFAIYFAAISVIVCGISIVRTTAMSANRRAIAYSDFYNGYSPRAQWASNPELPPSFGYQYRGLNIAPMPNYSDRALNWTKAESILFEAVVQGNGNVPATLQDKLTDQEIASALGAGDKLVLPRAASVHETSTISMPGSSRLIDWSRFSLTVEDNRIDVLMPAAKVTNEVLEKAVRENIKSRLSRLLKAMKARVERENVPQLR